MASHRVSSEVPADREVERPPFFVPAFPLVSLSLLILANAPEEDYVVLVPLMPRPSFLGALSSQRVSDGARIEATFHIRKRDSA